MPYSSRNSHEIKEVVRDFGSMVDATTILRLTIAKMQ